MSNNIEEIIKTLEEKIEILNKYILNYERIDYKLPILQELIKEKQTIENILNIHKNNQNKETNSIENTLKEYDIYQNMVDKIENNINIQKMTMIDSCAIDENREKSKYTNMILEDYYRRIYK